MQLPHQLQGESTLGTETNNILVGIDISGPVMDWQPYKTKRVNQAFGLSLTPTECRSSSLPAHLVEPYRLFVKGLHSDSRLVTECEPTPGAFDAIMYLRQNGLVPIGVTSRCGEAESLVNDWFRYNNHVIPLEEIRCTDHKSKASFCADLAAIIDDQVEKILSVRGPSRFTVNFWEVQPHVSGITNYHGWTTRNGRSVAERVVQEVERRSEPQIYAA